MAVSIDLSGRSAVVFGVANHRSIAWAVAQRFYEAGAHLTVTYQNERLGRNVLDLVKEMDNAQAVECDVLDEASIAATFDASDAKAPLIAVAHCVAFANRDDFSGDSFNFMVHCPSLQRCSPAVVAFIITLNCQKASPYPKAALLPNQDFQESNGRDRALR